MFQILKPKLETNNMMIPNHTKFIHTMVMWPKHILAKENKAIMSSVTFPHVAFRSPPTVIKKM